MSDGQDANKRDGATASEVVLEQDEKVYIAIVGCGPKGMYGLDRIVAQLKARPVSKEVEIHVYNKNKFFGSGDVYRSDQPSFLKMNISTGEVDMWMRENPTSVVPERLSFSEWLDNNAKDVSVTDKDFPPRALVGTYLEDGYQSLTENIPEGVKVSEYTADVKKLIPGDDGYRIRFEDMEGDCHTTDCSYHYTLLATGHPSRVPTEKESEYIRRTEGKDKSGYIPFIYPVDTELADIPAGASVGVKGIGLTCVDALLALTEGRGGRFSKKEEGEYSYEPSGKEPGKIYPFSRTGLPMITRVADPEAKRYPLQFFTEETIDELKDELGKLDFEKQLWPLIKLDMLVAHYKLQFNKYDFCVDEGDLEEADSLREAIDEFHEECPEVKRFDPEDHLNPFRNKAFDSGKALHEEVKEYIRFANQEAEKGPKESPFLAVSRVWNAATSLFGELYKFGGLIPESHRIFEEKYRGPLNRITYGPPLKNMKKLMALVKAGIVDFSIAINKDIHFSEEDGVFHLQSVADEEPQAVEFLVDARIPKVCFGEQKSGLYHNLIESGELIIYTNKGESPAHSFQPGCIAVTEKGNVVDAENSVNRSIAVTGTPTEGITFDNDALSPLRNNFVSGWAEEVRNEIAKKALYG